VLVLLPLPHLLLLVAVLALFRSLLLLKELHGKLDLLKL
jgi:hypothetical protein